MLLLLLLLVVVVVVLLLSSLALAVSTGYLRAIVRDRVIWLLLSSSFSYGEFLAPQVNHPSNHNLHSLPPVVLNDISSTRYMP